jgi:hypothetical protein
MVNMQKLHILYKILFITLEAIFIDPRQHKQRVNERGFLPKCFATNQPPSPTPPVIHGQTHLQIPSPRSSNVKQPLEQLLNTPSANKLYYYYLSYLIY